MGHLTEHTRRRIAAGLLAVVAAIAVFAIADVGPFADPPTEEDRAQAAVERFYGAAAEGDFATYCSLLTERARDLVRQNAARLLAEAGELECHDIVSLAADSFAGAELRIREVSVSGIQARVEADLRLPGGPSSKTVLLERDDDGAWLIYDPG